jgi:exodeoxyribonuclease V gamma subunit
MKISTPPTRNILLYYSNEAEALLDELASNLRATRNGLTNPLTPLVVAVPNTNVAQWLSYSLSERLGISANIDFIFLEKIFRRLIQRILPNAIVLNKATVEAALVIFLNTEPWLHNANLAPLGDYINHAAATHAPTALVRSARLFSLASQLAQAFDDYSLSRQEMIAAWNKNTCVVPQDHRLAKMEKWQQALWQALFGAQGFFEMQGQRLQKRYGFLGELFEECVQKALAENRNMPNELGLSHAELHFFGFSYVATGYIKMFGTLAEHFAVRFYALNPCAEFWEDSKTLFEEHRENQRVQKRKKQTHTLETISPENWEGDSDDLLNLESRIFKGATQENLALRLWGKPGREYTRALQSLTGCEFESCFRDPTHHHHSLLTHLQRCILLRMPKPEATNPDFEKDESITYLSCKGGPKRELEAIATEIWKHIHASANTPRPLRFNEVAIILPASEKEIYESLIHTVFYEANRLPHRIIDSTARAINPLVDAFARFLELPFADTTRGPLLRFLTAPALLDRHGGTAQKRINAAAVAHIFVGSNAAELKNTYIDSDAFNWDQGLFRLTLGSLMAGSTRHNSSVFTNTNTHESYVVEDAIEPAEVRGFVVMARSVLADVEFLRTQKVPLGTWLKFFRAALQAYLPPFPNETDEDAIMRSQCHTILSELEDLCPTDDTPLDGFTAVRFVLSRVQKLTTGENGLGLDGVMVASFLPMRPIPVRMLFVVGMGEGHFPSTDKHGPFDLRAARRRVADVTPREQDKYMFLETLLSVREKLYISWVARDQTDNEPLEPSGLVHELNQTLVEMGASPTQVKKSVTIPLRRWTVASEKESDNNTLCPFPEEQRERACVLAQKHIREELGNAEYPEKHILLECIPDTVKNALGISQMPLVSTTSDVSEKHKIPLRTLSKFLKNPLLADAEDKLHLRIEDYEEEVDVFEEPTGLDFLRRASLVRDAVCEGLLSAGANAPTALTAALAHFQKERDASTLRGDFPVGILGQNEAISLENEIKTICETLQALTPENTSAHTISFGEDAQTTHAQVESAILAPAATPLTTQGESHAARIVGSIPLFLHSPHAAHIVVFSYRAEKTFRADPLPDYATGFLQLCALRTLRPTLALPEHFTMDIVLLREAKVVSQKAHTPSPANGESYLQTLAAEYTASRHNIFLPSKAIAPVVQLQPENRWNDFNTNLLALWHQERESTTAGGAGSGSPAGASVIPNVESYLPPENASAICARRLDFLLNSLVHEGKKK